MSKSASVVCDLLVVGVRSFLRPQGIELRSGAPTDSQESDTVCGHGNRNAGVFMQVLDSDGVEVFEGTLAFLQAVPTMALKTACTSSSRTCRNVLARKRLTVQFDVLQDGNDLRWEGLPGKPQPDGFPRAAALLGVGADIVVSDLAELMTNRA